MDNKNSDEYTLEQMFNKIKKIKRNDEGLKKILSITDVNNKNYFSILWARITDGGSEVWGILTASKENLRFNFLSKFAIEINNGTGIEIRFDNIKNIKIRQFFIWYRLTVITKDDAKLKLSVTKKVIGTKLQSENLERLLNFIKDKYAI